MKRSQRLLKEALDAAQSAKALAQKAHDDGQREFSKDETEQYAGFVKTAKEKQAAYEAAKAEESVLEAAEALAGHLNPDEHPGKKHAPPAGQALSLGEHFVKTAGERLVQAKGVNGAVVSAPEFIPGGSKAASDTQVTTNPVYGPVLTQVDRTIIRGVRPRLVVADLLGSGTLSGNAISYFVEGALEGAFTTVAEGAAKPQLHVVDPTVVTDGLKKIAGWIKFTDEMLDDLDFIVSEINQRLLYELARFEELQLLNGNGSGTNVQGILQRSGIQTEARGTTASGDTAADTLFRALTKVSTGAGLDADGVIIHPLDYQALRLTKDANGQYFGGGFFTGEYGQGGILQQPPIWGLRTVVTPAIAQGTALVGAFGQAATVYRKGGVRVESTNSHANDFTSNLVTTRAEERVALAVRRPAGFVKTTLTPAP